MLWVTLKFEALKVRYTLWTGCEHDIGASCANFLYSSGLPKELLSVIWEIADVNQERARREQPLPRNGP